MAAGVRLVVSDPEIVEYFKIEMSKGVGARGLILTQSGRGTEMSKRVGE